MDLWSIIWTIVFAVGFIGFILISGKVIVKGFAEMRDLLKNL